MNVGFVYQILTSRESIVLFLDGHIKQSLENISSFRLDPRSM